MRRHNTHAGKLGEWQRLLAPLAANGADLPHLEAPRAQLAALLAEGVETTKAQGAHAAAKQDMSKRLKTLVTEGDRLATLLRQAVKQHYGIRSEKLSEFGLQPFRGRPRKAKATPETPQPSGPTPTPPVTPQVPADPTR